jgi:type IV pilus assembly protein PilZ
MGWGFGMTNKKDRRSDDSPPIADGDDRRAGRDRRQFDRILVDLQVDYGCEDTFLFAYITDISAMGIFIRTNNPEPPGTRLNLRFTPPASGGTELECEGIVIWVNPYRPGDRENLNPGMGIKFVDLTYDQRELLTELVKTFAYLDGDAESDQEASLAATADDAPAAPVEEDAPEELYDAGSAPFDPKGKLS